MGVVDTENGSAPTVSLHSADRAEGGKRGEFLFVAHSLWRCWKEGNNGVMEEGGAIAEKGASAGSRVRKIYKNWERRRREKKGAMELVFVLEGGNY